MVAQVLEQQAQVEQVEAVLEGLVHLETELLELPILEEVEVVLEEVT